MNSQFKLKLSVIMILFAILISFTIATVDYYKLKQHEINYNQLQVNQMEDIVKHSIQSIEKAYFLFGEDIAEKMETSSHYLFNLYDEQPNLDQWDWQKISELFHMDIYMINEENVITHSSLPSDIGLDFSICCQKLIPALTERREIGAFFADGIDMEQHSGKIKKYSYMATRDKKYLIQLGFSLQDEVIFKEFNFLKTIEDLVLRYPPINEINILNIGGYSLGQPVVPSEKLSPERRKAFEQALTTKHTVETKGKWKNEPAIYRYVYYVSNVDRGITKDKVLEIVYNQKELVAILSENKKTFMLRLLVVLVATIILSYILSGWLARYTYLAFHDSLTGLKNRAAFDDLFSSILLENKGETGLLLIDLDNFKLVNDDLGHEAGDELLKGVAHRMNAISGKKDFLFRWGGDEFVMILPSTSLREAETVAMALIEEVETLCQEKGLNPKGERVTVSIGIALAPMHGTHSGILYKRADAALYLAKEKGKNQYQIFTNESA